jgi:ribosomal-protein-alanine N-acetyltransferase
MDNHMEQRMADFPVLHTQRLILRELTAQDAEAVFAIHSDAQAMRWFGTDPITTPDEARRLIELFANWRTAPNPGIRWGLQTTVGGRLVGSCGFFKWNRSWKSCALAFELAAPAQGQGLMNEALAASLAWAFQHMALNRIEALVHPQNQRSFNLLENLGFQREGTLRQAGYWAGAHHDLVQLSLLREEHLPAIAEGQATR